jgi:hypothetical protein
MNFKSLNWVKNYNFYDAEKAANEINEKDLNELKEIIKKWEDL